MYIGVFRSVYRCIYRSSAVASVPLEMTAYLALQSAANTRNIPTVLNLVIAHAPGVRHQQKSTYLYHLPADGPVTTGHIEEQEKYCSRTPLTNVAPCWMSCTPFS
jgi:hypothetical protein